MDMVRLVNKGTDTFTDTYNNTRYTIAAGSEGFVPWDAMCLWLGDPRARDADERHRDRTDEYARLREKYGVYHQDKLFAGVVPQLEVYTLDGKRITTVAEDPEGEPTDIKVGVPSANAADTAAEIDALRRQVEQLTSAVNTLPESQRDQVVAVARGDLDPADVVAPREDTAPVPAPAPAAAPAKKAASAAGVPQDKPRTVKVSPRG
jgi:hypothetical protein